MAVTPASPDTVEHVLCVPTLLFNQIGHFDGLCTRTDPYLKTLLDPEYLSYRPRDQVEDDPSFKQLIPYCVFRHRDDAGDPGSEPHYLSYVRSKGGEVRLDAKRSVGIGGHISRDDGDAGQIAYDAGMRRELAEEVRIDAGYSHELIGLLNDDSNEVGRVHLGLVHLFDLDRPQVSSSEASIADVGFAPLRELRLKYDQFETWSQIVLDHLTTLESAGSGLATDLV